MEEDKTFELINENNQKETYRIIKNIEIDNIPYIFYTNDELNENGEIDIFVNSYEVKDNALILKEIPKDKNKDINEIWENIWQEV
ncbi:MAG: hypothetical protein PUD07_00720 [bacterium]|nr:hypothetical protein [bacterium]